MTCPHERSQVKDSRPSILYGSFAVRRRRLCDDCGARFTTFEMDTKQAILLKAEALKGRLSSTLMKSIGEEINKLVDSSISSYIVEDRRIRKRPEKQ